MDPRWFPDTNRPHLRLDPWLSAAFLTEIASFFTHSRLLRVAFGFPVFTYSAYKLRTRTGGTSTDDYLAAVNLFWAALRWIDLAIMRTAETSLWRVIDFEPNKNIRTTKKEVVLEQHGFWSRLKWSLSLCATYRGIGWNWRVKNVDPVSNSVTKRKFVIVQFLKLVRVYILSDLVYYFLSKTAFPDPKVPDVSSLPPLQRIAVGWAIAMRGVCDMNLVYYLGAVSAVLLGISEPQDWPPLFGSWFEMYSVRNAWGYCWHQFLRRLFEVYTGFAVNLLGIPKGSLSSRYIKLYGAFLLSAIIHHVGALNCPWTPGVKYQFAFFTVQPFLITFEDVMIHIGKQFGFQSGGFVRVLGHVWTCFAFSLTLPLMAKAMLDWAMLDNGTLMKNPLLVWSVADRLLG